MADTKKFKTVLDDIKQGGKDHALEGMLKSASRSPKKWLEGIDKDATKAGLSPSQRRTVLRAINSRFNTVTKESKEALDYLATRAELGEKFPKGGEAPKKGGKYLTSDNIKNIKQSFSGAVASVLDSITNLEPGQEGRPYTDKSVSKRQKVVTKAGADARRMRKTRMKAREPSLPKFESELLASEGKSGGGSVKKYSKGGGVRKAKR
tara:strand:+ start:1033 stop:1653 length:621 start_codon:yes stop_codon:yes gene_type:complete